MSKVAVLKTTPESVLDDYARLLALADVQAHLPRHRDCQLPIADCRLKSEIENRKSEIETALKINISWHRFYPACSTTPWQLEGVIRALIAAGYPAESLYGAHNRTVVVSARKGEVANKQKPILEKYGVRNVHLYEKGEEWARFEPKSHKFHVLHEIFPDGVKIPKRFIGSNIVHLPTMKTHVFTTMTGAMKNAFGGLLSERRHWT
ncbi:MAG: DUF362 domain-containing protein, partial [Planctomycetes bacterium]|nr:DUF362 domain-containing protein [Planctomycetota bacterium]